MYVCDAHAQTHGRILVKKKTAHDKEKKRRSKMIMNEDHVFFFISCAIPINLTVYTFILSNSKIAHTPETHREIKTAKAATQKHYTQHKPERQLEFN